MRIQTIPRAHGQLQFTHQFRHLLRAGLRGLFGRAILRCFGRIGATHLFPSEPRPVFIFLSLGRRVSSFFHPTNPGIKTATENAARMIKPTIPLPLISAPTATKLLPSAGVKFFSTLGAGFHHFPKHLLRANAHHHIALAFQGKPLDDFLNHVRHPRPPLMEAKASIAITIPL